MNQKKRHHEDSKTNETHASIPKRSTDHGELHALRDINAELGVVHTSSNRKHDLQVRFPEQDRLERQEKVASMLPAKDQVSHSYRAMD
jgi:hypothetical protein